MGFNNKTRRWFLTIVLVLFCLVSAEGGKVPVKGASIDGNGLDIVIVIDTSGSMKRTDEDRLAVEAAKLFVDMMETEGSKVALVTFSHKLGTTVPMTEINSQADKQEVKDAIANIKYTGDTDIGLALKKAEEILAADKNSDNRRAILFFTDGKIDLPEGTRTNEDSRNDALDVANSSVKENIPIYTIGLNSNGNVDEELISYLASSTGGRNYIVDNAEVLPRVFDEIFADFINSNIISLGDFVTNGTDFVEIPFSIDNNSVLEANVIMLSDKLLEEIQLLNPSGKDVVSDSKHVIIEESNKYTLMKLITPVMGDWMLKVKGDAGCKVHVNLIFNYKVVLKCEAKLVLDEAGDYIQVSAWLEKEDKRITDAALYQAFEGEVYFTSDKGSQTYSMTTDGTAFSAIIPADDLFGNVELYARIESESMYRDSDVVKLNIVNTAPVITGIEDEFIFEGFVASSGEKVIDISSCFSDAENDEIEVVVESEDGQEIVTYEITEENLSFYPKENGETYITIKAKDEHGAENKIRVKVVADYKFASLLQPILIGAGALAAVALLGVLLAKLAKQAKYSKAPFYGVIQWKVMGTSGGMSMHRLDYDRGFVPLSSLIMDMEASEMDLKKVVMHMNSTGDGVEIENKSGKCVMTMEYGSANCKKAVIRDGESVMLNGNYIKMNIVIQVMYGQ